MVLCWYCLVLVVMIFWSVLIEHLKYFLLETFFFFVERKLELFVEKTSLEVN